jgi:hypothetical protein
MSAITADHESGAGDRAERSGVKTTLTPNRRRRPVENEESTPHSSAASSAPTSGEWQPVMLTPSPT